MIRLPLTAEKDNNNVYDPSVSFADSFFWRKRQPFCHFVTFPLLGEIPYAGELAP